MKTKNTTLIIYGGNSNIIQSCIEFFLKKFEKIIMISRRYSGHHHKKIDVINYEEDNINECLDKSLDCDFVFLSASIFTSNKLFVDENSTLVSNSVNTNIQRNIEIIQYLIKRGIDLKKGKFIYLSSFRVDFPTTGTVLYSSSKAYMEKLFESLSIEYSRFNLKFNTIKIGLSEHGLSKNLKYDLSSKKFLKENISSSRLLNNDDLESAFVFLFNNNYINGTSIDLTGKIKFDLKS